jgi:beta-mannosidase
VVNGRPIFLQGVNFAPLCANYADLTREDYAKRLRQYHDLGLNLFRINACQFLEREWFFELCDELGLMVWQEFPLTSSGLENWPPEDKESIATVAAIAASFIERRRHHVSLLLWSGGNEQMGDIEGHKTGMGKPCELTHPMLKRLQEVVRELDPHRRYIPTSPCGPRASANPADFGKGMHWAVHGGAAMMTLADAEQYWAADDALFRPEVYCPGASPVATIEKYAGEFATFPATADNPYWTRLTTWWIDWQRLVGIHGREPENLAEYVEWSQANQALMMSREMQACKARFPRCGGVLMWSGHDTFPLTINSSLIDFDGNLKPAAPAVAEVWRASIISCSCFKNI